MEHLKTCPIYHEIFTRDCTCGATPKSKETKEKCGHNSGLGKDGWGKCPVHNLQPKEEECDVHTGRYSKNIANGDIIRLCSECSAKRFPTPKENISEWEDVKIQFDQWYKEQKEMNPYIMRDWFLDKLSSLLASQKESIVRSLEDMGYIDRGRTFAGGYNQALSDVLKVIREHK